MLFAACLFLVPAMAQSDLSIIVKDSQTQEALPGASVTIRSINKAAVTDSNGKAVLNGITNGKYQVQASYIGYESRTDSVNLPLTGILVILLEKAGHEELEEVTVSTTRSTRTISAIPTRIEVIAGEELDEKSNMKPGDIRMVLNESTGIQTQQTSATSANASIRIQGLDGRYTQILKDGFPVYSGAASGLGLLQTPPLDLKQVEVIKGSASTLYGGGAIAGLVNLVSKTPGEERELNFMLNGTSAGGLDLNGFYGQRYGKTGLTVFAARNSNKAYAPGSTDFTAIPEFERYTFNPKWYLWFNDRSSLDVGINSSFENRTGGDIRFIDGDGDATHSYFEKNHTDRLSSLVNFSHRMNDKARFAFRNSLSYFKREINTPGYAFNGTQYGSFSEASYSVENEHTEWVSGINVFTDKFTENLQTSVGLRNYSQTTFGAFVQNSINASGWLELETGLRGDYVVDYGFALLPRVSALFKLSPKLSSRIGGGLGYKAPSIFTEESERIQYRDVLPISANTNKLERSYGVNWDINYKTPISDELIFSINHMLFYTRLDNPLLMQPVAPAAYQFVNAPGHIDTKGMETNLKFTYDAFKLYVGYTFTDAGLHIGGINQPAPLTAKHRLNNVLMYEVEDQWKVGLEAYYYSRQRLNDGSTGKPYWITGFMVEKLWERFSLYINFENFTDTRQTRLDRVYTGTVTNPVFRDIYAPLDGFVVNGGIKFRL